MAADVWVAPAAHTKRRWRELFNSTLRAQAQRIFLWVPVALTFGIWAYFALAAEPGWPVLAPAAAIAGLLLWFAKARPWLALPALVLAGLLLAKAKTEIAATPVLRAVTGEVAVTGIVEHKTGSAARGTLVVGVDAIEGVAPAQTPRRLRLTSFRRLGDPPLGSRIAFKARLQPLPSPVMPGGFDYGRQLWFDGIGGTGRVTGDVQVLDTNVPWRLKLAAVLFAVRQSIGTRIRAGISDPVMAAIAEALVTGERANIPKPVNTSLQVSGLAHILSISGLHMSLVAGGIFWFVRAVLAGFPALAQGYPIKKWAAACALVAGLAYMLLAGSDTATLRSYIMIAVVFFAVLVDRPAISVRNLAFAGLIILVVTPEAAISASFQMSFMAVMGLAAFYEFWAGRARLGDIHAIPRTRIIVIGRWVAGAFFATIVTTVIAGTLSSIPAAYHFGRMAPYGIAANGLAIPVVSLVVMPMALAGVLFMPLGLEAWPLWAMGKGLELTLIISDWVAGFPGSQLAVPQQPAIAAIVIAAGAAVFCLLAGGIRFAGLVLAAAGLVLARTGAMPDLIVERTAATVALRNEAGELVPADARKGRFAAEKWLLANGEAIALRTAAQRPGWTCEVRRCTATVKGKAVAWFRDGEGGGSLLRRHRHPDCQLSLARRLPQCGAAHRPVRRLAARRPCHRHRGRWCPRDHVAGRTGSASLGGGAGTAQKGNRRKAVNGANCRHALSSFVFAFQHQIHRDAQPHLLDWPRHLPPRKRPALRGAHRLSAGTRARRRRAYRHSGGGRARDLALHRGAADGHRRRLYPAVPPPLRRDP